MCGIFGLTYSGHKNVTRADIVWGLESLFKLSETRGKEAAGLAIGHSDRISIYKDAVSASEMIRSQKYKEFISNDIIGRCQLEDRCTEPFVAIGHSRLVTNGMQFIRHNNQPVSYDGLVAVHNGIITNVDSLWDEFSELARYTQVDTEVLLALTSRYLSTGLSFHSALARVFELIEGTASVAILATQLSDLHLATNNGSIYIIADESIGMTVFASERFILQKFLEAARDKVLFSSDVDPVQIRAGEMAYVGIEGSCYTLVPLSEKEQRSVTINNFDKSVRRIVANTRDEDEARSEMHRCTRCILPETMPFIEFDEDGVCNYCHNYVPAHYEGKDNLLALIESKKRHGGGADALVMFSGGRDSSYGLHLIKKELDLNPIAYTYDWGMITDLGRRNQARLCGKLGVEHMLVSADVARKRKNVRKNIEAWLRRPRLGMIPLFMAGDKQYYYYANKIQKDNQIPLIFVCECPLELSRFKAGFCGIDESQSRIFDIPMMKRLSLMFYYARQYAYNPKYINSSFLDSVFAFWSSYFIKHDYIFLYNYFGWNEDDINAILINEYRWEAEKDYNCTWRIGDGTAAFYNYIYFTVAGFTENDTLRSNQIREGVISRSEALARVYQENQPRWDSIRWYANTIGFDLNEALQVINAMPKLYV